MRTNREEQVRRMDNKKLIKFIDSHSIRALDRLAMALANARIATHDKNPKKYAEAARSANEKLFEDLMALTMANRELVKRYQKSAKKNRKYRKMLSQSGDVAFPFDFFWEKEE